MKKLPHLLLVSAVVTATSLLSAQTPPAGGSGPRRGGPGGPGGPGGHSHGHGRMHPIVRALDADRDGELSAAELTGAPTALLALDADKDGSVSAVELRPARPANAPTPPANAPARPADAPKREGGDRPHPVDPVMLALDANTDGALSGTEIAAAARSLNALDLNKDGKLTRDELRPLPPTN